MLILTAFLITCAANLVSTCCRCNCPWVKRITSKALSICTRWKHIVLMATAPTKSKFLMNIRLLLKKLVKRWLKQLWKLTMIAWCVIWKAKPLAMKKSWNAWLRAFVKLLFIRCCAVVLIRISVLAVWWTLSLTSPIRQFWMTSLLWIRLPAKKKFAMPMLRWLPWYSRPPLTRS